MKSKTDQQPRKSSVWAESVLKRRQTWFHWVTKYTFLAKMEKNFLFWQSLKKPSFQKLLVWKSGPLGLL